MMIKRFISFICALFIVFTSGLHVFAVENILDQRKSTSEMRDLDGRTEQDIEQEMYDYYRTCDKKTGMILEKYDILLNGENTVDYVILATSLSMDKSDRIAAMNFITEIFDYVTDSEREYLRDYIQSYAPYTDETELHAFCEAESTRYREECTTTLESTKASYSRSNAVNYARTWYNGTNPAYPDLRGMGGDCANFVSQCMLAGGKSMNSDWYIYRKNSVYPAPTNSEQFDYSWRTSDPSPWISAKYFNNYWTNNSETYSYSVTYYKNNHETIYNKPIYIGDVVQIQKPVLWWYEGYHTMLIVGYSNHDFIYGAHSRNTINSTILGSICNSGNYNNYRLKFFHLS